MLVASQKELVETFDSCYKTLKKNFKKKSKNWRTLVFVLKSSAFSDAYDLASQLMDYLMKAFPVDDKEKEYFKNLHVSVYNDGAFSSVALEYFR